MQHPSQKGAQHAVILENMLISLFKNIEQTIKLLNYFKTNWGLADKILALVPGFSVSNDII